MRITEPGLYSAVDELIYHADSDLTPALGRSLSYSGAKVLLDNPARFAWERDHGRPPKDAYDFGHAAHRYVLGVGGNIERVAADTWQTKSAREAKAAAYAAGRVPLLTKDVLRALDVAKAVKRHPVARNIFAEGEPEVSAYAIDPETGVTLRSRLDWLHPKAICDLKTIGRVDVGAFGRSAASYDYPMQAAFYTHVHELITGTRLPFITVTVETEPPHFVTVGQYDPDDLAAGHARMRRAINEYAERESSGVWADPPTIITFSLPAWYSRT